MKPSAKVLIVVAAAMLFLAAISSITPFNIFRLEPVVLSIGSINLLIIARSFAGIQSWALFDREMHSFTDAQGRSRVWGAVAQACAVLGLVAFVLGALSTITNSPVFGSFQIAWITASVNLSVLSIVVSSSLSKSPAQGDSAS